MSGVPGLVLQYQRVIHATEGDCNQACVSTITGISIGELPEPDADAGHGYYLALQRVLDNHGWVYFEFEPIPWFWFYSAFQDVPMIASVHSQMFEGKQHAIVVRCHGSSLEVLHDPNPENEPFNKLTPKQVLAWSLLMRKSGLPSTKPV